MEGPGPISSRVGTWLCTQEGQLLLLGCGSQPRGLCAGCQAVHLDGALGGLELGGHFVHAFPRARCMIAGSCSCHNCRRHCAGVNAPDTGLWGGWPSEHRHRSRLRDALIVRGSPMHHRDSAQQYIVLIVLGLSCPSGNGPLPAVPAVDPRGLAKS